MRLPRRRNWKISGASIRFEKVSLSYAGQQVLREVSFSVESGQTVALVGPSGAGKTSLVNLLLRFWEPQAGGILIDDQDIASVKLASLRQNLALVSQESVLFDDTVAANIGFGNPEAGEAEISRQPRQQQQMVLSPSCRAAIRRRAARPASCSPVGSASA